MKESFTREEVMRIIDRATNPTHWSQSCHGPCPPLDRVRAALISEVELVELNERRRTNGVGHDWPKPDRL